ncbi:MAG: RNase adapter RapZ [Caryophanon sp.]|nr:RNase adapter RapZ [Caryophanon sp.]
MEKTVDTINNEVVIITGMSGAGKTVAVQSFEDLGYYCIDNLPPALLATFVKLMRESGQHIQKIAVVMDLRGGEFFEALMDAIDQIEHQKSITPHILFLDANSDALVRRYKESRRSHPLAKDGLPLEGIARERELLADVKMRAHTVINTSLLKPRELREKLVSDFSGQKTSMFTINVMSFGFKHGMPIDADLVFDVRFLPNPYYIDELRPKTGLQKEVSSYVLAQPEAQELADKLTDLFAFMVPQYKKEGKSQLVIAFGCTGGQHRSVTFAEYFGEHLAKLEPTQITHRDINLRKA